MKLIIFGATGKVGKQLVELGLSFGHKVTAVTRKPEKIKIKDESLSIITCDVKNYLDVENSIRGHDAVLCVLGDGSKGEVRYSGTKNIVDAMEKLSIDRLICQSTLGAGDSINNLNFFWRYIVFAIFLKKALQDHNKQEAYINKSKLNFTIVRPGAFTNGPLTKLFREDFDNYDKSIKLKISCSDIAYFMLQQFEVKKYHKQFVGISY